MREAASFSWGLVTLRVGPGKFFVSYDYKYIMPYYYKSMMLYECE